MIAILQMTIKAALLFVLQIEFMLMVIKTYNFNFIYLNLG